MSITIGIDPHKASHTAVAVDDFETVVDEICIRSCPPKPGCCATGPTAFETIGCGPSSPPKDSATSSPNS